MAVTAAQFKTRFEEFATASDDLVDACLTDAAGQMNADVWGDLYDQGVALRAAHILALSPFGMGLQLAVRRVPERNDTSDVGSTVYEEQWLRLRRSVVVGALCAGT